MSQNPAIGQNYPIENDSNPQKVPMIKNTADNFIESSLNPPPPPGSHHEVGAVTKFFQQAFIFVSVVSLASFVIWVIASRDSQVVSSKQIGSFVSMSGPGGFQGGVVIETELGSYPLITTVVISKGTPLVLEERASGDRLICDVPHSRCIKTTYREFKP